MTDADVVLRDLRRLEDCRAVVGLQQAVWGVDGETVPASVLLVSAKRGGILIGAEAHAAGDQSAAGGLVGFVWSMPGQRDDGVRTHWSHMLAVLPPFRQRRIGEALKWAQRDRALVQGIGLMEWTFDPLQAANAHFNLRVLGATSAVYAENVYGALAGPLHRGTPTDRLVVEWRLRDADVTGRLAARAAGTGATVPHGDDEVLDASVTIDTGGTGGCPRVRPGSVDRGGRHLLVPVPPAFSEMQQRDRALALAWRLAVREVMTTAFLRGYRAVDFLLDREAGGGVYLLRRTEAV